MLSSFTQGASSNPALVPDRNAYYVDSLFRSDRPVSANPGVIEQTNGETSRLFARGLTPGSEFTASDRTRVAQLVAARTGLSQQEAEQRVDQTVTQAKAAADQARKAAAKLAFWITPLVDALAEGAERVAELVARGIVEGSYDPQTIYREKVETAPPVLDELILVAPGGGRLTQRPPPGAGDRADPRRKGRREREGAAS